MGMNSLNEIFDPYALEKLWDVDVSYRTKTMVVYDKKTGKNVSNVCGDSVDQWLMFNSPLLFHIIKRLCASRVFNNGTELCGMDRATLRDARIIISDFEHTKYKMGTYE